MVALILVNATIKYFQVFSITLISHFIETSWFGVEHNVNSISTIIREREK